ncbi:MAG TPA: tryptophan halogenase family protein [Alphaproteobacteria bacterium]|nr:tryptophan halogenase family protein [Alphaproteobacteria bacterium]
MAEPVKNITIVGGGTAGWLTAIVLVTYLKWRPGKDDTRITLIESPNVPTVGVGEATVPGMALILRQCGIDEAEFFRRTNATFKMGVLFKHWNEWPDGTSRDFFTPFNTPYTLNDQSPGYAFQRFKVFAKQDFVDSVTPTLSVVARLKGPRPKQAKHFERPMGYAYHLDAGLFAKFMQETATGRGVEHIREDVIAVNRAEGGSIASLTLAESGEHPVELVIDCTGFRGMILNGALEEPFISYSDHLLNDSAAAVQIPHADTTKLIPFTSSTALSAGWVWNVPLYNRVGTGYVFSSAFKSDEEAKAELMAHLGPIADGLEPRILRMRVGRARRSWIKNCIAIGLSGGFIEPLEATAIYMIEMAARFLVNNWPSVAFPEPVANSYNKHMAALQEEIRDFIVTHYLLNNRKDPFWQAARNEIVVPETVKERLELWRHVLPGPNDLGQVHLFNYWNYQYVLFGKGFYDDNPLPLSHATRPDDWERYQAELLAQKKELVAFLPDHYELVSHIRGSNQDSLVSSADAIL